MKLLKRLFREEEGVTLIEYGLIAALIAVVAIVALRAAGVAVDNIFNQIVDALGGAAGGSPGY